MVNQKLVTMEEIYNELEKQGTKVNRNWKEDKSSDDYILIRNEKGYKVTESRYVWEKHNGKIPSGMVIHHINENKKDNRIENLQLVTFQEHMRIHKESRKK